MARPPEQKLSPKFKWQAALSRIESIGEAPPGVFTSEREAERAVSIYNRALEHMHSGNRDIAMIALEKLVSTYPLFIDAAVLYGLILGVERKFADAELQFQKALLSDPDPAEEELLENLLTQACLYKERAEESERSRRRNEKKLLPVRANLVQAGILERASGSADGDGARMASARERDELMRQVNQADNVSSASSGSGSGSGAVRIISFIAIIASLLFFLLYFLIVPAVTRSKERSNRLSWLEEKIEEGAETDEAFQVILDDYNKMFSD